MISIDGMRVEDLVVSISRGERKDYKYQLTTESGRQRSELRGRYPVYDLTFGNLDQSAYDALRAAVATNAETHTVTMPDGQNDVTFEAKVTLGEDGFEFVEDDGTRRWDGLSLQVEGVRPL